MARLTTKQRSALPAGEFALPSEIKVGKGRKKTKGAFPIEDIAHGRKAVQMASHAGPTKAKQIDAKVKAKFPSIAIGGKKGK